jgi:hypothetical protein
MTLILFLFLVVCAMIVYSLFSKGSNEESATSENVQIDEMLENIKNETRRIEAFIQAGIVGDQLTVDAINHNDYRGPLPERRSDGGWLSIYDNLRILKIAGINHRQGINHYVGRVECMLVPEPDNEYDPDAIKVVSEDGHHLGYIPSGQTDFVSSLSGDEFPYRCTAFIQENEDEDDDHKFFTGFVYIKRKDKGE